MTPVVGAVGAVSAASAGPAPTVRITFESSSASSAAAVSDGTAAVTVSAVGRNGGTVSTVSDAAWWGQVGRTPAFDARSTAPRGVLRIIGDGSDPLSPLLRTFAFGADVKLDAAPTSSHARGSTDNGDNVVQRGLFGDASQYKIQVDRRQPSCRVKGSAGTVMVKAPIYLAPGTWYRLRCTRSGSTVSLQVLELSSSGRTVSTITASRTGTTGTLRSRSWSVPLSVGGKLTAKGAIARQSDQFNGLIDNIELSIS